MSGWLLSVIDVLTYTIGIYGAPLQPIPKPSLLPCGDCPIHNPDGESVSKCCLVKTSIGWP